MKHNMYCKLLAIATLSKVESCTHISLEKDLGGELETGHHTRTPCSLDVVDWLDQRHHLVHVNASPHEPHADSRSPDDNDAQSSALTLGDVGCLLGKAGERDCSGNQAKDGIRNGSGDKATGHESCWGTHVDCVKRNLLSPRTLKQNTA